jgi:hypothetical protein
MSEENKMIAEFMGIEIDSANIGFVDGRCFFVSDMPYRTSWDWIMPVVERIEAMPFYVHIDGTSCLITSSITRSGIKDIYVSSNTKPEATYQAVINFIKFYNKEKV